MAPSHSFKNLTALVADDQEAQRSLLRNQLFQMGLTQVELAASPDAALQLLKRRNFDLVICDFNFIGDKTTGQQLLEHARSTGLLPATSIFVMVTGSGEYANVASVGDNLPDAFMVKPITMAAMEERIASLLKRGEVLSTVLQRMKLKDFEGAIWRCEELLVRPSPCILEILKRKAECQMLLGQWAQARKTYREVLGFSGNVTWARLGEAQCYKLEGDLATARDRMVELLEHKDNAHFVRAYDLLAEVADKQGSPREALRLLQSAAKKVPSTSRFRSVGAAALRAGELDVARECFQKVYRDTNGSLTARPKDVLNLAHTQIETGHHKDALALLSANLTALATNPDLGRSALALTANAHLAAGERRAALEVLEQALSASEGSKANEASVSLARTALKLGRLELGLKVLSEAVAADHENEVIVSMAKQALAETGNGDLVGRAIEQPISQVKSLVAQARALLSNGAYDEAVAVAEKTSRLLPDNTTVLLETAQVYVLWMKFRGLSAAHVERVKTLLTKLDTLLPESDRVAKMHRALRSVLTATKGV